jgi:hypothetical protein
MATAWSIQYLLLSFTETPVFRAGIRIFCKLTLFWMKYLDLLLVNKRGAVDAAAGTYFLGQRPAEAPAPERTAEQAQETQMPAPAQAMREPVPQYQGLIRTDVRAFR